MEYISEEEFKRQPIDIQRVFIDWWEPEIGDLFTWIKNNDEYEHDLRKLECCNSFNIVKMTKDFKGINEGDRIPLLTEGQLRKFIEDKTNSAIQVTWASWSFGEKGKEDYFEYNISFCSKNNVSIQSIRNLKAKNIFECYWKVACEIAGGNI